MAAGQGSLYDPNFVKGVFDRCSRAYRYWSQICSFGIITLWRRQCIDALPSFRSEGARGYDFITGTGEGWRHLLRTRPGLDAIIAVDISTGMVQSAIARLHRARASNISVVEADVLEADLPDASADFVVCLFGLKTFDRDQQARFAATIARVLKPGGVFSVIEASDPKGWPLRGLYMFHLKRVLPWVEYLFLRGAQDFSVLGEYTANFADCRYFAECLTGQGLKAEFRRYFFGCATGVTGERPR